MLEKVEENASCKAPGLQQLCSLCIPSIIPQMEGDNILEKRQESTCMQDSLARTQKKIFLSEMSKKEAF